MTRHMCDWCMLLGHHASTCHVQDEGRDEPDDHDRRACAELLDEIRVKGPARGRLAARYREGLPIPRRIKRGVWRYIVRDLTRELQRPVSARELSDVTGVHIDSVRGAVRWLKLRGDIFLQERRLVGARVTNCYGFIQRGCADPATSR